MTTRSPSSYLHTVADGRHKDLRLGGSDGDAGRFGPLDRLVVIRVME